MSLLERVFAWRQKEHLVGCKALRELAKRTHAPLKHHRVTSLETKGGEGESITLEGDGQRQGRAAVSNWGHHQLLYLKFLLRKTYISRHRGSK